MLAMQKVHRFRSFVRRDSRKTAAQKNALVELLPIYGLDARQCIQPHAVFENVAPVYLEIGFGSGQSLLTAAQMYPEYNFIGVETHKPGIGALLLGIERLGLDNLKIFDGDAFDILSQCFPEKSLAGVEIFFPDPWPKRRHHNRRLIQTDFLDVLISRLETGASIHLATDWEDYALHMLKILMQRSELKNLYSKFADRSPLRPILTKFEKRAIRDGRTINDLQFIKL